MNPAKYLRWSFWEKFLQNAPPIFGKHSILVVRQGSEYASVMKHFKVLIKQKKKFILIFTKLQNLPSYCRLLFNLPFLTNFYISPRCSLK